MRQAVHQKSERQQLISRLALLCLIFGVLSLGIAFYLAQEGTAQVYDLSLQQETSAQVLAPQDNATFVVRLSMQPAAAQLSGGEFSGVIEGDVLDPQGALLFQFNELFQRYLAYDGNSQYYENETEAEVRITLPQAGEYTLTFRMKAAQDTTQGIREQSPPIQARASIAAQNGSALFNLMLGVVLCVLAFLLRFIGPIILHSGFGQAVRVFLPLLIMIAAFLYILF